MATNNPTGAPPNKPTTGAPPRALSTNVTIYNSNTALYLDVVGFPSPFPALDTNNSAYWTLPSINYVYFFQSPMETSTPYKSYLNLSYNGGAPYMDTYSSANSVMYAVQDMSSYWLISPFASTLGTTLYLATDSYGNLSFTSTLSDAARWTRTSDGTNFTFNNKSYSSLYLQAMANGHIVQASAYNGSFANQYDWAMVEAPLCNISYFDGTNTWYMNFDLPSSFPINCTVYTSIYDASFYWIQRANGGSYTYENLASPGSFLQADSVDGVPIGNTTFIYSDQASPVQLWTV